MGFAVGEALRVDQQPREFVDDLIEVEMNFLRGMLERLVVQFEVVYVFCFDAQREEGRR